MLNKIKVDKKFIGEKEPCFIIAEIGSNHNNDWDLALEHIDAAVSAGADAVKIQTFKADSHVSKKVRLPSDPKGEKTTHGLLKSLEINRDWQEPLFDYCKKNNIIFFSSPCDFEAVDQLDKIGVSIHKVASFDLPDLTLVEYIAKKLKPIILSTGMADWMEIQRAVDICRKAGNNKIILLQCTSLYPAPAQLSNLRSMNVMSKMYNVHTGYSDHTIGDTIACAAVAMGAKVIEKHFTLDRKLEGPDHHFAIEPDELKNMILKIREIESSIGDGLKIGPRSEESENAKYGKRSIHASLNIDSGQIITKEMLAIKRPGFGISPYRINEIINKKAKRAIEEDEWITWDMIK